MTASSLAAFVAQMQSGEQFTFSPELRALARMAVAKAGWFARLSPAEKTAHVKKLAAEAASICD